MHLNSASSLNPAVQPTGLQNRFMPLATLRHLSDLQNKHLLGVIAYTTHSLPGCIAPVLHVPAQVFAGDASSVENALACEAWFHEGDGGTLQSMTVDLAEHGEAGGGEMHYRHDGEYVFGTITLPEAGPAENLDVPPLQHIAALAYRHIFRLLDTLDYQHVYRFWNYIADINGISHGQERYRQFNIGRQDAFLASQRALTGQLPAACALGTAEGPLTIAFLAGRRAAQAVENPRQVSAYEYPEVYGPRSPSFSRATLLPARDDEEGIAQDILFISGTASIVGHETLHAGDVQAQARETLANLEALIGQAQSQQVQNRQAQNRQAQNHKDSQAQSFDSRNAVYRVYLRDRQDLPIVEKEIARVFGARANTVFLQADVCRDDLLLEIEATLFSTASFSSPQQPASGALTPL